MSQTGVKEEELRASETAQAVLLDVVEESWGGGGRRWLRRRYMATRLSKFNALHGVWSGLVGVGSGSPHVLHMVLHVVKYL